MNPQLKQEANLNEFLREQERVFRRGQKREQP